MNPIRAKLKDVLSNKTVTNNKTKANIAQQQIGGFFNRQEVTIVAPEAERNEASFVIGVLGGLFGILGISYIFNHQVPRGLAWLIVGTVCYWIFILMIATLLLNISEALIVVAIALHLFIIWNHAKYGARNNLHPAPKKKPKTK